MKVRYDDQELELAPRVIAALKELMAAECEMMADTDWAYSDCWEWGRCVVGDMSSASPLTFEYGSNEDPHDDGLGNFAVIVE